jgi:ABC-type transport system involved in cytochrome bd biosynthesis fused ATPase/permease subunit
MMSARTLVIAKALTIPSLMPMHVRTSVRVAVAGAAAEVAVAAVVVVVGAAVEAVAAVTPAAVIPAVEAGADAGRFAMLLHRMAIHTTTTTKNHKSRTFNKVGSLNLNHRNDADAGAVCYTNPPVLKDS